MAGKLGRKIALVAGGSSGIGLATAKGVHDGCTVSGLMSVTTGEEE
jgi:NAD(P)-dependent dehydrogenase (short-subunit alcohol dehydrogenase family)